MWVRVVRVRRIVDARNVRIPFQYITHRDANMESGVRKIIQQGAEGLKVQRFAVVLEDGRRVSSTLLGERVLRPARNHIVRVGTREPTFKGEGASQEGLASWYTSDGLVGAHRSLPLGSVVRVTNVDNGRSVNVRITDRGPWVDGRVIDLSDDAFQRLAPLGKGTIKVKVQS
jgi:rare lipoprotein A (peptidoglycan hydrolase)